MDGKVEQSFYLPKARIVAVKPNRSDEDLAHVDQRQMQNKPKMKNSPRSDTSNWVENRVVLEQILGTDRGASSYSDEGEKPPAVRKPQMINEVKRTSIPEVDRVPTLINTELTVESREGERNLGRRDRNYSGEMSFICHAVKSDDLSIPLAKDDSKGDIALVTPDYDKDDDGIEKDFEDEFINNSRHFKNDPAEANLDHDKKGLTLARSDSVGKEVNPIVALKRELLGEIKTFHKISGLCMVMEEDQRMGKEALNRLSITIPHTLTDSSSSLLSMTPESINFLNVEPDYDETSLCLNSNQTDFDGDPKHSSRRDDGISKPTESASEAKPKEPSPKSNPFDRTLYLESSNAESGPQKGNGSNDGLTTNSLSPKTDKKSSLGGDSLDGNAQSKTVPDPAGDAVAPRRPSLGRESMVESAKRVTDTERRSMSESEAQSSREVHMKALSELQTSSALRARPDVVYGTMIPEPDYSDDDGDSKSSALVNNRKVARNNRVNASGVNSSPQKENKCGEDDGRFDDKGLILPKKLANPCLDSSDKKSLHRELMFNQKVGINVLNQKSELQKAMEKHKGKVALKEQEKEKQVNISPLQRAIDERAQRLEKSKEEAKEEKEDKVILDGSNEFQKVHAKFRSKIEAK